MKHSSVALLLIISLAVIGVCIAQDNYYPSYLVRSSGTDSSSDVTLAPLATKDQRGSQDTWDKYVEFYGSSTNYIGVFSFAVNATSAESFSLNMNYRGPAKSEQWWVFEWYVPSSSSYVLAGNNSDARDWAWTTLSFPGETSFSSLVSSSGVVQLRMSSLTVVDACDLDFLQLSVTGSSSSSPSVPPTSAPATPAPVPTLRSGDPTTQPTVAATMPPTVAPTMPPTAAATHKPTSAPATPAPVPTLRSGDPTSAPSTAAPSTTGSIPTYSPSDAPTGGRFCPNGTHYRPGPYTTWQWQLSGTIDTTVDVQVYDIDMFGASVELIETLHSKGIAVVCYIDTAYEPGRPDSADFTPAVLGADMAGWPGEKWVDIRSDVVRNIMANRMALAASKQCDAVEMDDVDSYQNKPGFPLTAADQADFNTYLANTAHTYSLGIALKNDIGQVAELAPFFDFAVNEQCFQYDECSVLNNFIEQGKAVFGVEYDLSTSKFCTKANADQYSWMKKDLNLDASRTQCCTTDCGGPWACIPN